MAEILKVDHLKKHFPLQGGLLSRARGKVYAVDDVSFRVERGENLGLVGESGCGKTTVARAILRLIEPTAGTITFMGRDIGQQDRAQMRALRKEMQMVFQDPYASLNPRMKVGDIIGDPLDIHGIAQASEREQQIAYLLESVGLQPEHRGRYPHEFSGGQRQRIGIARALATEPKLVIGDEPVSALDVSIRAQIINLLEDLQERFDLSYIIISHDLAVIEHLCDRIAVMYLGKIVEMAPYQDLYNSPLHPYTEALLSAVPIPDPEVKRHRIILQGDVPSPFNPPSGCPFRPRCLRRKEECERVAPPLKEAGKDRWVACNLR